jgi:hypothetical protein
MLFSVLSVELKILSGRVGSAYRTLGLRTADPPSPGFGEAGTAASTTAMACVSLAARYVLRGYPDAPRKG